MAKKGNTTVSAADVNNVASLESIVREHLVAGKFDLDTPTVETVKSKYLVSNFDNEYLAAFNTIAFQLALKEAGKYPQAIATELEDVISKIITLPGLVQSVGIVTGIQTRGEQATLLDANIHNGPQYPVWYVELSSFIATAFKPKEVEQPAPAPKNVSGVKSTESGLFAQFDNPSTVTPQPQVRPQPTQTKTFTVGVNYKDMYRSVAKRLIKMGLDNDLDKKEIRKLYLQDLGNKGVAFTPDELETVLTVFKKEWDKTKTDRNYIANRFKLSKPTIDTEVTIGDKDIPPCVSPILWNSDISNKMLVTYYGK